MSEVTFAKQFLTSLDKKPIKLAADHVSDPRKYPSQSPYTLPKRTHPFPRRVESDTATKAQAKTITATLKPMKAGATITIADLTLDNTIYDIKAQYAQQNGLAQDKVKILFNKKPAADLKTFKELGIENDAEFSVMLMAGAVATPTSQTPTSQTPTVRTPTTEKTDPLATAGDKMDLDEKGSAPESEKARAEADTVSSTGSAETILKTDEFWSDLQGFLSQRLRNEKVSKELSETFRNAWTKR